jgi:hypothetical protein
MMDMKFLFSEWLVSNNVSDPNWHMQLTPISQLWHAKGNVQSSIALNARSLLLDLNSHTKVPTCQLLQYIFYCGGSSGNTDVNGINVGACVIGGV